MRVPMSRKPSGLSKRGRASVLSKLIAMTAPCSLPPPRVNWKARTTKRKAGSRYEKVQNFLRERIRTVVKLDYATGHVAIRRRGEPDRKPLVLPAIVRSAEHGQHRGVRVSLSTRTGHLLPALCKRSRALGATRAHNGRARFLFLLGETV